MAADTAPLDPKLEQILTSAAEIFAEKGYHQASIRDISRATGISLSGLYYYVRSKEEILFRIQDHAFGTILDDLQAQLEGVSDPVRRLRLLVENHLRYFVHNMHEMKVLSHEADSLEGEYRARVNEKKKRYGNLTLEILREIHRERPEEAPVDLRVATFSLFGMMNWIYNWYRPHRDVPVGQLAEDISRLFLSGFAAEAAAALPAARSEGGPDAAPSVWKR